MHTCERMASHLWPSARLKGDAVLPSTAGLVSEACVREGCPARTGARLGDAAIAATHSSSAGALAEAACKTPHLISSNVVLQAQMHRGFAADSQQHQLCNHDCLQIDSNAKYAFITACTLTATSSVQPRCTVRLTSRHLDAVLPQGSNDIVLR